MDRHHLDRCNGGLESLVARLHAGAVQRLFQRLAGQHAEAVRHARLLLRLADAARNLRVDRLVVRRLAAQQAAQRDDRIHRFRLRQGARRRGNLPRAGHAHPLHLRLRRAERSSPSSAPCNRRSVITAFQRATTIANCIPAADSRPDGHRLAVQRILRLPEADPQRRVQRYRK